MLTRIERLPASAGATEARAFTRRSAGTLWLIAEIVAAILVVLLVDQVLFQALTALRPPDHRIFIQSRQADAPATTPDILVLGDSHIADAYVPAIVQAQTGLTSFNFGVYGSGPLEWEVLARDLLARWDRPPRLAVIGTSTAMLHRATSGGRYTPELISSPMLRLELLRYSGLAEDWFLVLPSYRQRYLVPALLRRLAGGAAPEPIRWVQAVDRGYLKNVRHMNPTDSFEGGSYRDRINQQQLDAFRRLLDVLAAHGVKAVIADPPLEPQRLRTVTATPAYRDFERALDKVLTEQAVRRFNFRRNPPALQLDYRDFLNAEHVCASGAAYFSTFLAAWLSSTEEPPRRVQAHALAARAENPCRSSQPAAAA